MKDLRKQWGAVRYAQGDEQTQRKLFLDSNISPFFEPEEGQDLEGSIRLEQMESFRSHLRSIQQEKWSILQTEEDSEVMGQEAPDDANLHAKRQELLGEIATEQFRSGMLSWLTSVNPENALSSSSLEELEEIEHQTKYRLKVLEVVQLAMEQELDAIEKEIRAKRVQSGQTPQATGGQA